MTIDERLEALTMNVELISRDVESLRQAVGGLLKASQQDGENIRALARIAEIHERRLGNLEEGQ
jgi:hypothetical protein